MEPRLAARFPQIKTYKGKGIDDPTATARFDTTPTGFHAIVLSARGTVIIGPAAQGNPNVYLSYDKPSVQADGDSFVCSVPEAVQTSAALAGKQLRPAGRLIAEDDSIGRTLRTYRLAVAATAEYTQVYGGGTVSGALAAITTTINLVNAIYERDVAVRLMLVAGETNIIFTDPATDGFTSDAADTMYNQNQNVLDTRIGANNYDIGHVFDGHIFSFTPGRFFFQGRGELASVCVNGLKGKGVSIFRSLEPAAVNAVYVVAHEMGHQFGASHTFNGTTTSDCLNGRVAATAFEPGTGSTIMGYRGSSGSNAGYFNLCGAEDLHSSDLYFHIASVAQIVNYTTGGNGKNCPGLIETGNNPPTVDAGADYTIPRSTPFMLTATASDPDGDALTYCWEELDLGAPAPPNTDDGSRPIFRSFAPVTSPSRTFPQLSDILSGTSTFGESLPVTTRTMNFRVTVRDNHPGGGGGSTDAMLVSVVSGSGPFAVMQPGASTNWAAGSARTVTWDVAQTSNSPVSCANVRILLSVDGGVSFPITLAPSVPNNGAATITVPPIQTSMARVKVEAIGNIFFAISNANFEITPGASPTPQPPPGNWTTTTLSPAQVNVQTWRQSDGNSYAKVKLTFPDAGYRVQDQNWGAVVRSGSQISVDALVEKFDGVSIQSITTTVNIYNLGPLPDGVYTFNFKTSGITAGSINFTVSSTAPPPNPIDNQREFVRWQYKDFLGREPDQAGWDFWTENITKCLDANRRPAGQSIEACIDRQRETTSAAFFLSPEFQYTGYFVYRIYKGALGRAPYLSEFTTDQAFVGSNIINSTTGQISGAQINQNKAAFANQFAQRAEFLAIYSGLTNTQFVDRLFQTTGVTPTASDRQALIDQLNANPSQRGDVLFKVVDGINVISEGNQQFTTTYGQAFYNQQFNSAFVQMEYFGYMRRDPDNAGFVFWLGKLNIFGNYIDAQMVRSFVVSPEYRSRFGAP